MSGTTIFLYGKAVPAHEYETTKRLVDLLVGKSDVNVPIKKARDEAFRLVAVCYSRMKAL